MNLRDLWTAIECDLTRARQMLPSDAADNKAILHYKEFFEQNELELGVMRSNPMQTRTQCLPLSGWRFVTLL